MTPSAVPSTDPASKPVTLEPVDDNAAPSPSSDPCAATSATTHHRNHHPTAQPSHAPIPYLAIHAYDSLIHDRRSLLSTLGECTALWDAPRRERARPLLDQQDEERWTVEVARAFATLSDILRRIQDKARRKIGEDNDDDGRVG